MDVVKWKDFDGNLTEFSVSSVWESIRPRGSNVNWYSVVWFSTCIPKHAFVLWLLMGEKLKTQDKLRHWDICPGSNLVCPLCELVPDSHNHLFFTCSFSNQVWMLVRNHMDFPIHCDGWHDFTVLLTPFGAQNIARIIVIKLLLVATVYCL
ncbi:uncharacterized protein [Rutidosis leptorrhynchoides]|uniref:uncharacterized protein n=1 Tax=Rutidosis leptorrhynchoides TaxID=125765 RepID=UPI003A995807